MLPLVLQSRQSVSQFTFLEQRPSDVHRLRGDCDHGRANGVLRDPGRLDLAFGLPRVNRLRHTPCL